MQQAQEAQEENVKPMAVKVNFDFQFFTEDGSPVHLNVDGERSPLKLKEAAIKALLYPPKDTSLDHLEKKRRYDIAVVISSFGNDAILNTTQKELIKKAMGEIFIPIVVGQACDILDGKEPPKFTR